MSSMLTFSSRALIAIAFVATAALQVSAAEILIADGKAQPESLTVAPGGVLIVGSASTPFVYRIRSGSTTAEPFVDATAEGAGTFFFGMLADAATHTLWTCQITPVPDTTPIRRHTALRGFDLSSGRQKIRWELPGDSNLCNDVSIGPDKAVYITDTLNGKVFRLAPGATAAEPVVEDRLLVGIDGITFLNGTLYVNNVFTGKLYRVPVSASGKAGPLVELHLDQPVRGPDGMRAGSGKIFVAENGSGKISMIAINGDSGTVTVLKDGLKTPTAVEPAGDVIWIAERGTGKAISIPMPR